MSQLNTREEILANVAEIEARLIKPIDGQGKDCAFSVWFPRSGCPQQVTAEVAERPYCAEHARIKAIYLVGKAEKQ